MPLYNVRLEMAREPGFPEGNRKRGYQLVLPLDAAGKIDANEWKANPKACTVERFWDGEFAALGYLEKHPKGQWVFDFDFDADDDDEAGFRFGDHTFNKGDYVSIAAHDGKMHTFTVVSVTPAG
ncbi:MAG: hypothetical protein Kow0026_25080 [Oricola sp.]